MVADQHLIRQRTSIQTKPYNHGSNVALETTPRTGQYGRSNRKGEAAGWIKGFKHPKGVLGDVQLQTKPCNHGSNLDLEITPQTGQYGRSNRKGEAAG